MNVSKCDTQIYWHFLNSTSTAEIPPPAKTYAYSLFHLFLICGLILLYKYLSGQKIKMKISQPS